MDGTKTSALFYLGSKVTHSCDPNAMALAIGIQLAYRAIRPIKKGEPITPGGPLRTYRTDRAVSYTESRVAVLLPPPGACLPQ